MAGLFGALTLGPGRVLLAQPQPTPPSPAAANADACQAQHGSLSFIGCSLAQQLGLAASGAEVSVVALKSERELPAPDTLRERVRDAVAMALAPRADGKATERSRLRVELSLEASHGVLRVSADVRRATGLWQRIRHAKPSVERHAFAEVTLDAELRALIPPPPLVVSEVLKLKAPERGILAMACGRLGPDGGQELALVSRSHVRVGRIVGHVFKERKSASWSSLSAVAPAPLREPIGSAEITPDGALRVGLTDRRDGLELSPELEVVSRFEGRIPVARGCVSRSDLGVLARYDSCSGPATPGRTQPLTLDAVAGRDDLAVGRDLGSGRVTGTRDELARLSQRVGAQLAVGDADSDSRPELAYSADTLDAARDRVTLVTLDTDKAARRFELPAPAIGALAICEREGAGMAPLVIATGEELWLVR